MSYAYIKNVFPTYEANDYSKITYNRLPQQTKSILKESDDIGIKNYEKAQYYGNYKEALQNTTTIEKEDVKMEIDVKKENNCEDIMSHVLNCYKCREGLFRYLNIDNDRVRQEEMMEIISYILFGIFVLFLVEHLKK